MNLQALAPQSMKWRHRIKGGRIMNVSSVSSLKKWASHFHDTIELRSAVERRSKIGAFAAAKIVLIAVRCGRGDNHLRRRNIRNSISLTMLGAHRIICASFRTVGGRWK
jgi:hypothetical protein